MIYVVECASLPHTSASVYWRAWMEQCAANKFMQQRTHTHTPNGFDTLLSIYDITVKIPYTIYIRLSLKCIFVTMGDANSISFASVGISLLHHTYHTYQFDNECHPVITKACSHSNCGTQKAASWLLRKERDNNSLSVCLCTYVDACRCCFVAQKVVRHTVACHYKSSCARVSSYFFSVFHQ